MLSFDILRLANKIRLPRFKNSKGEPAHARPDGSDWDVATWIQAVFGELGELAEVRLAYEHDMIGPEEYAIKAAKELADVQIYLDILALRILDMPPQPEDDSVASKMNDAYALMHAIASL